MAAKVARYEEWLTLDRVRQLSNDLGDGPELRALREESHARFLRLPLEPNPLYRGYGYFNGVDLTGLDPDVHGPALPLPPPVRGAIRVVHDASGTRADLPDDLLAGGARFVPFDEWRRTEGSDEDTAASETEEPTDRLSALATAIWNRGYRLELPNHWRTPIRLQEITVLSQPHEALSVRRSVRAGDGVQLYATEEVFSAPNGHGGQRLYASRSDLSLGDDAKVVYLGVHAPDLHAVAVYRRSAVTGSRARLAWLWNGLGGFRTKVRNHTRLTGPGSSVEDLQTYYGSGEQSFDSSFDLTHSSTDTHGQSITRGVFTDSARGMSRGLVRIEPNAAKTIAVISEHAMLLSKGARSDTIPILEILCRDVKATHSTSVAPVDPEKVFYLESRGMPKTEAIRMIGEGFLSYVLERAPVTGLREALFPALSARWEGRPVLWSPDSYPLLPELPVSGTEAAPEWRFDTKLR